MVGAKSLRAVWSMGTVRSTSVAFPDPEITISKCDVLDSNVTWVQYVARPDVVARCRATQGA